MDTVKVKCRREVYSVPLREGTTPLERRKGKAYNGDDGGGADAIRNKEENEGTIVAAIRANPEIAVAELSRHSLVHLGNIGKI